MLSLHVESVVGAINRIFGVRNSGIDEVRGSSLRFYGGSRMAST